MQKHFCWKSFLANSIFVVSHLKTQPAVHWNTSKAQLHCSKNEEFIKSLLAVVVLTF